MNFKTDFETMLWNLGVASYLNTLGFSAHTFRYHFSFIALLHGCLFCQHSENGER